MTLTELGQIVNSPGGIAILALVILIAGAKGIWVYGHVYRVAVDRERERAEEWKDIAMGVLPVAEKTVELAERRAKPR